MMSPLNREKVDNRLKEKDTFIGTLYKRTRESGGKKIQRAEVRFDGVSGALRTPAGGSSRQTVIVIKNGEVRSRLILPQEAAALMGIPNTYKLPEKYNDAYHLLGDGVVVPVVTWLKETIFDPYLKEISERENPMNGTQEAVYA
jgi:DNA (cytosine-5)-methyltransferase 1